MILQRDQQEDIFGEQRYTMEILIQKIEAAEPFSAMELFSVNRGTLTTILGITVTYCIVMFQTITC